MIRWRLSVALFIACVVVFTAANTLPTGSVHNTKPAASGGTIAPGAAAAAGGAGGEMCVPSGSCTDCAPEELSLPHCAVNGRKQSISCTSVEIRTVTPDSAPPAAPAPTPTPVLRHFTVFEPCGGGARSSAPTATPSPAPATKPESTPKPASVDNPRVSSDAEIVPSLVPDITPARAATPPAHQHSPASAPSHAAPSSQSTAPPANAKPLPSQDSFWLFQSVLVLILLGSALLVGHRKRLMQSAHERRIERLVNA